MDMQTIKRNVESGLIRTTAEFQRDLMLMFTNAIMYNASNHDVYHMAKNMYDDVMEILEVIFFFFFFSQTGIQVKSFI
jgi:bromodomain-containing protein 8